MMVSLPSLIPSGYIDIHSVNFLTVSILFWNSIYSWFSFTSPAVTYGFFTTLSSSLAKSLKDPVLQNVMGDKEATQLHFAMCVWN